MIIRTIFTALSSPVQFVGQIDISESVQGWQSDVQDQDYQDCLQLPNNITTLYSLLFQAIRAMARQSSPRLFFIIIEMYPNFNLPPKAGLPSLLRQNSTQTF